MNVSLYLSVSQQIFIEPKAASYKVLGLEQGFVGGGEGQWVPHLRHGVHTHARTRTRAHAHTGTHILEPVTWGPTGLIVVDFMSFERVVYRLLDKAVDGSLFPDSSPLPALELATHNP